MNRSGSVIRSPIISKLCRIMGIVLGDLDLDLCWRPRACPKSHNGKKRATVARLRLNWLLLLGLRQDGDSVLSGEEEKGEKSFTWIKFGSASGMLTIF